MAARKPPSPPPPDRVTHPKLKRGRAVARGIYEVVEVGPRGGKTFAGYYEVAYYVGPSRRFARAKGPETLEDARARQRQLYREGRENPIKATSTTLRAWSAIYFAQMESNAAVAPSTVRRVLDAYRLHMDRPLGRVALANLDTATVQPWVNALTMTLGKSDETRRTVPASPEHKHTTFRYLVQILRAAARAGYFGDEHAGKRASKVWRAPCDDVVLPPLPEKGRDEIATPAERAALLEAAAIEGGTRAVIAVCLGLKSAFRHGELAPLRWDEHVTFHAGPTFADGPLDEADVARAVEVRIWLDGAHTKTGVGRPDVVDDPETVSQWIAHRLANPGPGPVLARKRALRRYGRVVRDVDAPLSDAMPHALWARIRERAGLPRDFPFHALRHSAARDLIEEGKPITAVQLKLGHAHTSTSIHYVQRHPATREAAIRAVVQGRAGDDRAMALAGRIRDGLARNVPERPTPRPTSHPCVSCGEPAWAFCATCGTRQPPRVCACGACYPSPAAKFCATCGEARPVDEPSGVEPKVIPEGSAATPVPDAPTAITSPTLARELATGQVTLAVTKARSGPKGPQKAPVGTFGKRLDAAAAKVGSHRVLAERLATKLGNVGAATLAVYLSRMRADLPGSRVAEADRERFAGALAQVSGDIWFVNHAHEIPCGKR